MERETVGKGLAVRPGNKFRIFFAMAGFRVNGVAHIPVSGDIFPDIVFRIVDRFR